jgi:hypothetical protein
MFSFFFILKNLKPDFVLEKLDLTQLLGGEKAG